MFVVVELVRIEAEEVKEERCQALFVPGAKPAQLRDIVSKFAARPVLLNQLQVMPLVERG
jgi:hypothetical protein